MALGLVLFFSGVVIAVSAYLLTLAIVDFALLGIATGGLTLILIIASYVFKL